MYMKSTASVGGVGAGTLAATGSNVLFTILLIVLLLVMGFTLLRLARSRPSQAFDGPAPQHAKRRRLFLRK